MDRRDVVRVSLLVNLGGLAVVGALGLLVFGLGGGGGSGSPFGVVVVLAGLVLLAFGLLALAGAGADAVAERLGRLRRKAQP